MQPVSQSKGLTPLGTHGPYNGAKPTLKKSPCCSFPLVFILIFLPMLLTIGHGVELFVSLLHGSDRGHFPQLSLVYCCLGVFFQPSTASPNSGAPPPFHDIRPPSPVFLSMVGCQGFLPAVAFPFPFRCVFLIEFPARLILTPLGRFLLFYLVPLHEPLALVLIRDRSHSGELRFRPS